ncbi:MAG: protein NO VEIN domain-containing protein [Faecousia sp.]
MEKLAVKKLTHSDLTFFQCYYSAQKEKKSKQKALNLNSDVLVDELYPELKNITATTRIPVSLYIYGPGIEEVHVLQRKILKSRGSKNWRLNGELVYSPEDNLDRYKSLKPGDIVVLGFDGKLKPSSIFADFLSDSIEEDYALWEKLDDFLSGKTMKSIEPSRLRELSESIYLPPEHSIYRFFLDEDMVSVAEGDTEAILHVYKRSGTVMTADELVTAKEKAAHIGSCGEELVSQYFERLLDNGEISDFTWTSRENAVAPYDFEVKELDGSVYRLDVKSTTGKFEAKIHISGAELLTMAEDTPAYKLFRVYEISEDCAKLRIAPRMSDYAKSVLKVLSALPKGISVDSVSCDPRLLDFMEAEDLVAKGDE